MPRGMIETLCTVSVPGQRQRDQRVAHLVMRDDLALVRVEQAVLLFEAGDDALDRRGEVVERHRLGAAPRRQQRRLVDEVGEIGAGEARGQRGDCLEIDIGGQAALLQMHLEDLRRGRSCRAGRPAPGGRSGRRAAAPDRGSPAGWSRPAAPARCADRSRRARPGAG